MTLRVALIGCGAIARRAHLDGWRAAGADVVAFASRTRASAEAARAQWGGGEAVDEWSSVLERDDVDAVDLCTPNALHAEAAIAAARAGKHVLVEKPMACTVAEADAMIAAAENAGVALVPAHNSRFHAPFVAAAAAVAAGRIGTVTSFRCAWGHGGPAFWAPDATWFYEPALAGGGALLDLGVHAIDTVHAVIADTIVDAHGVLRGGDVERSAHVAVVTAAGAVGSISASWEIAGGIDVQLTVAGSEASLHLDARTPLTLLPAGGAPEAVTLPESVPTVFGEFIAAATGERPARITAADGRAAVAAVEMAYRSAGRGR